MQQRVCSNRMKTLAAAVAFIFAFVMFAAPAQFSEVRAGSDYVLGAGDTTYAGGEVIELTLTNNSEETITVTGPVDVKATVYYHGMDLVFEREALSSDKNDVLFGGAASLDIAPGETKIFAVVAPGLPDTWRSHTAAEHDIKFNVYLKIGGVDHHLSPAVTVSLEPIDFNPGLKLVTNSPVTYEAGTDISLEIWLENTSAQLITIKGPVLAQGEDGWSLDPGHERQRFNLIGGETMTVNPGQTVQVADIEAGPPFSWRNFYFPKIVDVTAWVEVTASADGAGMWQSQSQQFAIVGEIVSETFYGEVIDVKDMEDGTAAITVMAWHAEEISAVHEINGHFEQIYEVNVLEDEPVLGMKRADFSISKLIESGAQSPLGDLISVRATDTPGEYILTWAYSDGTHNRIVVEGDLPDIYYGGLFSDPPDHLTVTISTLNRPVEQTLSESTGKYEGSLTYPSVSITFTSDEPIDAEISLRQKGSTARPLPVDGPVPAGLYFDITATGELDDVEIMLEISYSRDDIPEGMNENDLKLFRYNEATEDWDLLPDQEVDTENQVIRVWMTGFSEFGIFEYAVTEAEPEPGETPEPEPGDTDTDDDRESIPDTSGGSASPAALLLLVAAACASLVLSAQKSSRKNH